jgi:CBS domain-containing protein
MKKICLFLLFLLLTPLTFASCGDSICNENISLCMEDCYQTIEPEMELYGRLLDTSGVPVPSEVVLVEWIDKSGIRRQLSTTSIDTEKAFHLGDPNLIGYYFITKGQANLKNRTVLTIKTFPRYQVTKLEYIDGLVASAGDLEVSMLGSPVTDKEIISSFFRNQLKKAQSMLIKSFAALVVIIPVLILLLILYRKMQKREKKEKEQDMTTLLYEKLDRIMSLNPITVNKNQSIFDALEKMVDNRINSIVVVEGKLPVGIITEDNFLRKVYLNDGYTGLKIRDIMSWPLVTAPHTITMAKAIKILVDNKIRKLPLVQKENLVGIVTITNILKALNTHPGKDEYSTIPIIQDIFRKEIVVMEKTAKITDVIKTMIEKNSSYVLVFDGPRTKLTEPLGIITTKDLLYEFYKNSDSLKTLSAIHMMKSPIETIRPGMDIFEANTHMLYMNFRRMPVKSHKSILGVLTQIDLLKEIYGFLREKSLREKN